MRLWAGPGSGQNQFVSCKLNFMLFDIKTLKIKFHKIKQEFCHRPLQTVCTHRPLQTVADIISIKNEWVDQTVFILTLFKHSLVNHFKDKSQILNLINEMWWQASALERPQQEGQVSSRQQVSNSTFLQQKNPAVDDIITADRCRVLL